MYVGIMTFHGAVLDVFASGVPLDGAGTQDPAGSVQEGANVAVMFTSYLSVPGGLR